MIFTLKNDVCPKFCLEGMEIENSRALGKVGDITIGELKTLVSFWVYSVLESLQEPKELLPLYYHRKEAAEKLGISLPILDELLKTGALPAKRISHRPVILHEDLLNYMRDHIYTATLKEDAEPGPVESFSEFSKQKNNF